MDHSLGPDAFYSAKFRLRRAQEHLDNLKTQIDLFFGEKPYIRVNEPDPTGTHEVYKIRLIKTFPVEWRILATEIIEHARASIDHATWASAYLHKRDPNVEFATFPFAKDPEHLNNRIKGASKECPQEIQDVIREQKPYTGGNGLLCVLNDMCNLSKHALLTFLAGARVGGLVKATAADGAIDFFDHLILDPKSNEIPYMRLLKGSELQHEVEITPYPSLDYRGMMSEEPAVKVLSDMIEEATRVCLAIQKKCGEIGLK
jgi:hypothetical protein